jgi:hypothetical protein
MLGDLATGRAAREQLAHTPSKALDVFLVELGAPCSRAFALAGPCLCVL